MVSGLSGRERRGIGVVAAVPLSVIIVHALVTLQANWLGSVDANGVAALVPPLLAGGVAHLWKPAPVWTTLAVGLVGAVLSGMGLVGWVFIPVLLLGGSLLAFAAVQIERALPADIDGAWHRSRGKVLGWAVLGLVFVLQVSRLSVFMADNHNEWGSTFPPVAFSVGHMCMGSYVHAADLTREASSNIYAPEHYPSFEVVEASDIDTTIHGLQPYFDDAYLYPPPFLLLPRTWLLLSNDYLDIRSVWFAFQFLAFAMFAVLLARWIGGVSGRWALFTLPLLLASMPTMFNFQFGQAHVLTVWVSIAGMLALAHNRRALGGALLAWGIASKIFPGVLVVYLMFQKRWRDVGWVAAFTAAIGLVSLAVLGTEPFAQFLNYQLPRLASGDAFSFITDSLPITTNLSIPGTVWKLDLLGVDGAGQTLGAVSTVYTLLLVAGIWWASRLKQGRAVEAQVWLAILVLASLRSPIVPIYGAAPVLWLLTLQLGGVRTGLGLVGFAISWLFINGLPPAPSPALTIGLYSIAQLAVVYWTLKPLQRRSHLAGVDAGGVQE